MLAWHNADRCTPQSWTQPICNAARHLQVADIILVAGAQYDQVRVSERHVLHLRLVLRVAQLEVRVLDVTPAERAVYCSGHCLMRRTAMQTKSCLFQIALKSDRLQHKRLAVAHRATACL